MFVMLNLGTNHLKNNWFWQTEVLFVTATIPQHRTLDILPTQEHFRGCCASIVPTGNDQGPSF